jgi:peptide/nickel transport system substrate-binding protein
MAGLTAFTGFVGCSGNGSEATDTTDETSGSDDSTDGEDQGGQSSTQSINLIIEEPINAVDPLMAETRGDRLITTNLYASLFTLNPRMEPVPDLAAEHEFVDDTTLDITLRENVQFHNGDELTASDVKFSLNRIQNSSKSPRQSFLEKISEINTDDDYGVTIHLSEAFGPILTYLTDGAIPGAIVPQSVVEEEEGQFETPVGAGPFQYKDWSPENEFVMEKFDDYYEDGVPQLDEVVIQPIGSAATMVSAIQAGDAQILLSPPIARHQAFEADQNTNWSVKPGTGYDFLGVNNTREPYDDVNLRRALSMSIDREALIETALYGQGVPAHQPIPTAYEWAVSDDIDTTYTQYNPEQAQSLIKEHGYSGLEMELTSTDAAPHNEAAEVLQQQLSEAGFKVQVDIVDIPTFVDRAVNANFDIFFQGFSDVTEPDYVTRTANSCGATLNRGKYCNEELDQIMSDAAGTYDLDERASHYEEVSQIYASELPDIPVWFMPSARTVRNEVQNFEHHITAVHFDELSLAQ